MKVRYFLTAGLILSWLSSAAGQQTPAPGSQTPKDKPATQDNKPVVRISVTLVQVDVTVTDSKGRRVTDLKAEDFQVFQNNKPQQITNFSYVTAQPPPSEADVTPIAKQPKGDL